MWEVSRVAYVGGKPEQISAGGAKYRQASKSVTGGGQALQHIGA